MKTISNISFEKYWLAMEQHIKQHKNIIKGVNIRKISYVFANMTLQGPKIGEYQ